MLLNKLLDCCSGISLVNDASTNQDITGLTEDSRQVTEGYLFAAISGEKSDGQDFINEAIKSGAKAVLTHKGSEFKSDDIVIIECESPRSILGQMAAMFYRSSPEVSVAVTGTNGKTSVVNFVRQIWHHLGIKAASIGTLGVTIGLVDCKSDGNLPMTTPSVVSLHKTVAELIENGVKNVAIEASSHGLDQSRISGLKIDIGAFTNFTRDHLDYHENMESYFAAKIKLFTDNMDSNSIAVLNADIDEFHRINTLCKDRKINVVSFGKDGSDIKMNACKASSRGLDISIELDGVEKEVLLPLFGEFQASNVLCAIGIVMSSGVPFEHICDVLNKLTPVSGRMEGIMDSREGAKVFIDYAHTHDALENVLSSLRGHLDEGARLVTVFGCGGDRDQGKRLMMGQVASRLSDMVIVTDDNPRTEDPSEIRRQVLANCEKGEEVADRREAISEGLKNVGRGDILLIAGKGHEKVQIIGKEEIPFDDVLVTMELINSNE